MEPSTNSSSSQINISKDKDKEKEIYFIVLSPKTKDKDENIKSEELHFKSEYLPQIIHTKEIQNENGLFIECKTYKLKVESVNNLKKEFKIEYAIKDDIYTISFNINDNSFVYNNTLQKGDKYLDNIVKEEIDQKAIPLFTKLQLFLEALEKIKETNKIEKLYEETINLYKKEKEYNLLIILFILVYQNKKLCMKLLGNFDKINILENAKVDKHLVSYLETFKKIFSDEDIIKTNNYDPKNFYGIILCYLYYYDTDDNNFLSYINKLYKINKNTLYEILIKLHSYFLKPLDQDLEFYNDFFGYAIEKNNKDEKIVEKVLKYIKDIETFLNVIIDNKDNIIEYYKEPIKIKSELKLIKKKFIEKNEELNELTKIINLINNIIDYSNEKNKLLIYFTSQFWINLLKQYNHPDKENIDNCYKLRQVFKKYYKLVKILYKIDNNDDKQKDTKKMILKLVLKVI